MVSGLTPEDVVNLWGHLSAHYGTVVIPKETSPLMRVCGSALAVARIQSRDQFMQHYTTVIHRRIYLPYALDAPAPEHILWRRLATGVHEHQHVAQAARDGFVRFASTYLTSQRARAIYEAEAYGCDIELMRWAGRSSRSAQSIADGLSEYGCNAANRDLALDVLRTYETDAGPPKNEATRLAVDWLSDNLYGQCVEDA